MKRKPMRNIVYLKRTMPSHIMHGRPKPSGSMACLMVTLLLLNFCDCQKDVSQMSPKSSSQINEMLLNQAMSKTNAAVASTKLFKATTSPSPSPSSLKSLSEENNTRQYIRVMRSAQPILNDNNKNHPNISPNNVHVTGKYEKEAAAGRYYQYNIKPTGTHDTEMHNTEAMYMGRSGKTLKSSLTYETDATTGHFLGNGDQRHTTTTTTPMSRVPSIQPPAIANNSVTSITSTVTVAPPLSPRQNSSPDIQDIITGIVKLLNGNVNVHANTQGVRRPAATRINNRGPPRISDVQAIPFDYENQKPPSSITPMRPAHFSFERPDRPFITGVPIPEQIVPYRPNFVSNHPPWHRTKPRPPINTNSLGGRRPIPQYKPLPSSHMKPPQEEETAQLSRPSSTHSSENVDTNKNIHTMNEPNDILDDSAAPTINSSQDTEVNSSLTETFYNATDAASMEEPSHSEEVNEEELQPPPGPSPTKKEDSALKKKPNKFKTNEKKKLPSTDPEDSNADANPSSKYISMSVDITDLLNNDHTTEEVIFMTASKTPELDATKLSNVLLSSTNVITTTPTTLTSTSTLPLDHSATSTENIEDLKSQINPTLTTSIPILTTTTSSIITSYSSTITTTTETTPQPPNTTPITTITPSLPPQYHPRPGIVLDDPEFKPGGSRTRPQRPAQAQHPHSIINPTRQQLPPGYGEIFDVTLSAIQGPGSKSGSQHTINIKPYGSYSNNNNNQDIIISAAAGEDGFVSIDGTRTYINLFGDTIDPPNTVIQHSPVPELIGGTSSLKPDGNNQSIGNSSSDSGDSSKKVSNMPEATFIAETDVGDVTQPQMVKTQQSVTTTNAGPSSRPHYRPRTTQPPVRIDTCIVGDDSTCDQAQHERCKTENGVSSCHCRPGYSRRKHREPCRRVITFCIGMRVDRIYEHRIVWDNKLADRHSEPYGQLSYESIRAMDSAMSMTPYSDEFMEAKVNNIYHMEGSSVAGSGVFVNLTIKLDESIETLRPNLRSDVQKHLLGVLHRRNNNIGKSVLFVTTPEAAITPLRDLDECRSHDLNDCHVSAMCSNVWGSFRCTCLPGTRDHWADQPHRAGRECLSCADAFCNNRGTCSYNAEGQQLCNCDAGHYGSQCEIDGEVLGVAIGASVAAVIIIVLTLICLVMWSRRWQREQKNAIGSPVFGYMNAAPLKSAALLQSGYQLTLEDRMRWAQVADVMSPTNYYGTEPIGPTRPSSAMFAYPNLPIMGVNTITNMPMQSSNMQQMHQNATLVAPPVPMPRGLGLSSRTNGMRTLENSSSSDEEDRTDLLGRNFQVPRPKSRSNGSITNQSGIYYDVDYQPSGNGIGSTSVDRLYGSQNPSSTHSHISSNQIPGPQGIPMSTYTSGRAPSSYYIK